MLVESVVLVSGCPLRLARLTVPAFRREGKLPAGEVMGGGAERSRVDGPPRSHIREKAGSEHFMHNAALPRRERLQLLEQVRLAPQRIPGIMRSHDLPEDKESLAPPHAIMRRN